MVSVWWLFAIILVDVVCNEYREHCWRTERKDLYDRLMAGSLNNYKEDIQEKPPPKGGNMFKAGMKKAAQRQLQQLETLQKAGDG